jgi:hypothetical protein
MSVNGRAHFALRLRDRGSVDVFSALAEILATRTSRAATDSGAVGELLGGLRQWQTFLTATREGLSVEAQRGLFGELLFLGRVLVPATGARLAVDAWKGAARAQQDFQFPTGAVEVKTTAAAVARLVRVTSERQLDALGAGALFLHVIVLDERDVAPATVGPGETLSDIVSATRSLADADSSVRATLDDGLLHAGWVDASAARYDVRRLTVRTQTTFRVLDGFPRLLEQALPRGVNNVSYDVELTACKPFEITATQMLDVLAPVGAPTPGPSIQK